MESRAAVFTSKPQAVEVYQAGAWWAAELLGWRHAADGSCQVWVRVVLGGAEETAWTDLETLRLPERHLAMAPEPVSAVSAQREMSVARHPSSRREHRAAGDASTTASLPRVRDLSVVPDTAAAPVGAVSSAGRRRAPEVPAAAPTGGRRRAPEEPIAGGRRRAPETPAAAGGGGRRRAPEESVVAPAPGRRRAPESANGQSGPAALLGRHSVPAPVAAAADPGRHRTADTGLLPVVSDATATLGDSLPSAGSATPGRGRPLMPAAPATVVGIAVSGSAGSWSAPSGLEAELLTRPMRLSDRVPHARRPRPDGAPRSV
jgi:hypothetical protein